MYDIPEMFRSFLRWSTVEDVEYLAQHMRALDKKEVRLVSGSTPLASLQRGFLLSNHCFTLVNPDNGELVAMGGIGQPYNSIWLLLHKRAFRHHAVRQKFARYSPKVLQWLLEQSQGGFLGNVTLAKNAVVIRWLTWLGAVTDSIPADAPDNLCGHELVRFMFYNNKEGAPCVNL